LPVAVFFVGGSFFAVEDYCPHRAGPLSEGSRKEAEVSCPWHGARFDLRTGSCLSDQRIRALRTFSVTVEKGHVYVSAEEFKS
jgi:nitrite reductase/ring-hydroxylating ferredoxin subunit